MSTFNKVKEVIIDKLGVEEDAIKSDQDPEGEHWVEFNKTWSQKWEVIDVKKDPLPNFEKHSGEQDKLKKYFNDK